MEEKITKKQEDEETTISSNQKKEKQMEDEKEKNKQQQEENKKLKLEIGKLKSTIKGKEEENKHFQTKYKKMQREMNITKKEMELTEIRTAECVRIAKSADMVTKTTQTDKVNSEVDEAVQTEQTEQIKEESTNNKVTKEQHTQTIRTKDKWFFNRTATNAIFHAKQRHKPPDKENRHTMPLLWKGGWMSQRK